MKSVRFRKNIYKLITFSCIVYTVLDLLTKSGHFILGILLSILSVLLYSAFAIIIKMDVDFIGGRDIRIDYIDEFNCVKIYIFEKNDFNTIIELFMSDEFDREKYISFDDVMDLSKAETNQQVIDILIENFKPYIKSSIINQRGKKTRSKVFDLDKKAEKEDNKKEEKSL